MNKLLLLGALSTVLVGAAEPTVTVEKSGKGGGEPSIPQKRDPQQTDKNPTTQVIPNTGAAGNSPGSAVGSNTVDQDLRNRILVSLSTGSIGTQGVIATNQLTDIKVTVTNRQVTLRGEVLNEKFKETIGKRVAGLDGVKGVKNDLIINPTRKPKHAELMAPDGYGPANSTKK
jgi:osmotically-inducible protein OsmY